MLFRTNKGTLINIVKYEFINDKLYYQKILEIKQTIVMPKLKKTFNNKNN